MSEEDGGRKPRPMQNRVLSDWLRLEKILAAGGGHILFEHDGEMWKIVDVAPASSHRRKADIE